MRYPFEAVMYTVHLLSYQTILSIFKLVSKQKPLVVCYLEHNAKEPCGKTTLAPPHCDVDSRCHKPHHRILKTARADL